MFAYTLRRLLFAIPTILAVVTICYVMVHLTPGGPFDMERKLPPAVLANLQAKYHLNETPLHQYFFYLSRLLHGDLGASFKYGDWTVNELVAKALPVSLAVGGLSVPISMVIGIAMGTVAAVRRNSAIDYVVSALGNVGNAVPSFVLGPVLILVFALLLQNSHGIGLLPAGGWGGWRFRVLPITLLTIINVATISRVMRGSLLEVLSSSFVRTARAKGLPERTVILRHAMRPALMPVLSLFTSIALSSITAAIVTETVFSLPGLGQLIINGAINRDYTLVLGLVVLVTAIAVLFNLIVDLLYAVVDPRIRY
jgi:oligopeptide transport system permease protein